LKIAVWNRIDNRLPPGLSHIAYGGLRLVAPIFLPHLDEISPAQAIGAIPADVPVLILAGAADRLARPVEARALFARVSSHARLFFVPGAGHGDLLASSPELYRRTVLDFIAPSLMGRR
jgi:pimeloyl-ACP methyl ester carboxylesterase